MLTAIGKIIQLARCDDDAIDLQSLLDLICRAKEITELRYVLRHNVLLYGL